LFSRERLVSKVSSCQEVEVPERWRIENMDSGPTDGYGVKSSDYFELRRLSGRVAIAVKSASGELISQNVYSDQKYSFALTHPTALKRISDDAWSSAPALVKPLGPDFFISTSMKRLQVRRDSLSRFTVPTASLGRKTQTIG
jgi:hypothetical protein